jgi:hypothetical protein
MQPERMRRRPEVIEIGQDGLAARTLGPVGEDLLDAGLLSADAVACRNIR